MASFNKITIVGYLGKDPEIRYLPDGTAVCNFSVATTEKRKDRSGEMQESTIWFRINVWGKQADAANQYLTKGRQVYVEGRLSQQEYTDRDGNKRTSLEVRATDVQFLGSRGDDGSQPSTSSSTARQTTHSQQSGEEDNEIPF
jgi:single-strand DNA-binding protein